MIDRLIIWLRRLLHLTARAAAMPLPEPIKIDDYFAYAFGYLLPNEGGFSNDPDDTPTNFGITMEDLSKWREHQVTVDEVRNMPLSEAKAIFHSWYWTDIDLGLIKNRAIATAIFDQGVLNGTKTVITMAQLCCNNCGGYTLEVDGVIRPATAKALNEINTGIFLFTFCRTLQSHFADIIKAKPTKRKFYGDWIRRADKMLTLSPARGLPE